ncbi:MAG: YchF/TatD family DNA exonuclease [Candidatus Kaelpia aquatica]|nr:YchF/TatD family DNA exonuclease [Candidatus Kaelpia aquatica]
MYLVDTHSHLWHPEFKFDLKRVIDRARADSVEYMVVLGIDLETSLKSLSIARKFKNIYAAVGSHPHNTKSFHDRDLLIFKKLLRKKKVVAFGEIGLDYYRKSSTSKSQILMLEKLLGLWQNFNHLPLVVHNREAGKDILSVLDNIKRFSPKVIMHCFSGDIDFLKQCLKRGFYISYATNLTFSRDLKKLVKHTPLDRLLLETDSPYLAPSTRRGSRNEPAFLKDSLEVVLNENSITEEDLRRSLALNSKNIFGIGSINMSSKYLYRYKDGLYINLTNRCSNKCYFCSGLSSDYFAGHNLRLRKEPKVSEVLKAVEREKGFDEITFCGIGEPFFRFKELKEIAKGLKSKGYRVRIVTNGCGNLISKRNLLPELKGYIDSISVSLNVEDKDRYNSFCKPSFGDDTFNGVVDFIKESKKYIPWVEVSFLDIEGFSIEKARRITDDLEVKCRVRPII